VLLVAGVLTLARLYTLQPNEAAIIQLFGAYRGTSRVPGLRVTNPFYTRKKEFAPRPQRTEVERLAQAELRSTNAQVEFLLRDARMRRGRLQRHHDTPLDTPEADGDA
jgi:hypothetical protein